MQTPVHVRDVWGPHVCAWATQENEAVCEAAAAAASASTAGDAHMLDAVQPATSTAALATVAAPATAPAEAAATDRMVEGEP